MSSIFLNLGSKRFARNHNPVASGDLGPSVMAGTTTKITNCSEYAPAT